MIDLDLTSYTARSLYGQSIVSVVKGRNGGQAEWVPLTNMTLHDRLKSIESGGLLTEDRSE